MLPGQLHVPVAANDQDMAVTQQASEEFQQQQRWLVGPMEVVQHQQQGPKLSRSLQEAGDAVEEPESGLDRF